MNCPNCGKFMLKLVDSLVPDAHTEYFCPSCDGYIRKQPGYKEYKNTEVRNATENSI